jgi:hypothetical protein
MFLWWIHSKCHPLAIPLIRAAQASGETGWFRISYRNSWTADGFWRKEIMKNWRSGGTATPQQDKLNSSEMRGKFLGLALVLLLAAIPQTGQSCIVTNLPPTVCVELLPACQAKIVIKGYTTYAGAPGSQFCSCAFAVVPSILSVDSVELRSCFGNDSNGPPCGATGPVLPGFDDGLGNSTFVTDNLANSFFAAASGSALPWQGFFSAVYGAGIPPNSCVDIIFIVTLQNPCSIAQLAGELSSSGPILGASSAQPDGTPNGGHLSLTAPASISIGNPKLTITKAGNQVIIVWPASTTGVLQQAVNVTGPWSTASGSGNPRTNAFSPLGRYYRLGF